MDSFFCCDAGDREFYIEVSLGKKGGSQKLRVLFIATWKAIHKVWSEDQIDPLAREKRKLNEIRQQLLT